MTTGENALPPRYRAVAELLARGASNAEIAAALALSVRTVEGYVSELKELAAVPDRGRLILWCTENAGCAAPPSSPE